VLLEAGVEVAGDWGDEDERQRRSQNPHPQIRRVGHPKLQTFGKGGATRHSTANLQKMLAHPPAGSRPAEKVKGEDGPALKRIFNGAVFPER
jgi:hypothetical protein